MAASKPVDVDGQAAGAHGVLGQVERKAVGVVELEGGLARQDAALGQARGRLLEQRHAAAERAAEALLLLAQGLGDAGLGALQLRIGVAHLATSVGREPPHQRLVRAQQVGVAHGAAHDPAQHIAAALVRGRDAVGDQEGRGAQVVGDDPVRGRAVALGRHAGQRRRWPRSGSRNRSMS